MQRTIPYDVSHFPVSPLDLEFLLAGLDGLVEGSSPTDNDLSQVGYDEDVPQTGNSDARIELEDGEMEEEWTESVLDDYAKRFDNAADDIAKE